MRPVARPDVTAEVLDQPTDHVVSAPLIVNSLPKTSTTVYYTDKRHDDFYATLTTSDRPARHHTS